MSDNRKQRLLSVLREWTPELHISQVDNALYALHEESLTKKDEQELRTILNANPHLSDPELRDFVAVPALADEFWWLNPENW